jgi:hypothetical protein
MAFAGMSPGYPDAVCALTQGSQEKLGIHPSGTRDAHHPDIGWVFHPSDSSQIGSTIAAPVAQKGHDFGFPFRHGFLFSFIWLLAACFWLLAFCPELLPVTRRQQRDASEQ